MKSNENFITLRDNGVQYGQFTDKQFKFMQKCLSINENEGREFCCGDFPEMSSENFRQYVFQLKNYIVSAIKSYPMFYQIKGVNLIANNSRKLVGTILGDKMLALLNKLPRQEIIVKDLQIEAKIDSKLFNVLVNFTTDTIEFPQEILWENMEYDSEILVTVKITPELIQIKLEAKNQPIIYDMYGILRITKILGILEGDIRIKTRNIVTMPSFILLDQPSSSHSVDSIIEFYSMLKEILSKLHSKMQIIVTEQIDFDDTHIDDSLKYTWTETEKLVPDTWTSRN